MQENDLRFFSGVVRQTWTASIFSQLLSNTVHVQPTYFTCPACVSASHSRCVRSFRIIVTCPSVPQVRAATKHLLGYLYSLLVFHCWTPLSDVSVFET